MGKALFPRHVSTCICGLMPLGSIEFIPGGDLFVNLQYVMIILFFNLNLIGLHFPLVKYSESFFNLHFTLEMSNTDQK